MVPAVPSVGKFSRNLKFAARRGVEPERMNRAVLLLLGLAAAVLGARAADSMPVYVQVIWGTDQDKPAGASYHEVGPKLSSKLSPVFRWKHYWETERKKVLFDPGKVTKVSLANQ